MTLEIRIPRLDNEAQRQDSPPPKLLYTAREASRMLGICDTTLRYLGIPRVMVGTAVRYALDDLQKWIAESRVEPVTRQTQPNHPKKKPRPK